MKQERFRRGLRPQRARVLLLCARQDAPLLRPLLTGGEFTITYLERVTSLLALLVLRPDIVVACCISPDEVRRLRQLAPHLSLVVCSSDTAAHVDEAHIVRMLDAGADDYVQLFTCGKEEMQARVRRHVRRARESQGQLGKPSGQMESVFALESEDRQIRLRLQERSVMVRGQTIHLSTTECAILFLLMREGGRVLSGTTLLQAVWGEGYRTELDYLRVYMRQLRLKLEADPKHPLYLETIPRVGYRFCQPCTQLS